MSAFETRVRTLQRLHQGEVCTISRIERSGGTVIIKQLHRRHSSDEDLARLEHEYAVLRSLNIEGIPQAQDLIETEHGPALVFADHQGWPIRRYISGGELDWQQWLRIAIDVCGILERLHQSQVTHKQVNPDHILVDPDNHAPLLIDFSHSLQPNRQSTLWGAPGPAPGHLAYSAPEQSGRINRVIDYRTDYYGLGATLYEALTGRPPFVARDYLELVHCHIARNPEPPHSLNRTLPEMVSRVVLKLLAKDASDRYQSAGGIAHDLDLCLRQWEMHGGVETFPLGRQDVSARFQVPQKLYGRNRLLEQLATHHDACARGEQALILVRGYTGIGKSSLVHELRQSVGEHGGLFTSGKFDPHHRTRPYSALLQALQGLLLPLLAEPQERLQDWQQRLTMALGSSLGPISKLLPELGLVLGNQAINTGLSATMGEAGRLHAFTRLLEVFTSPGQPLLLFLDDLQWADLASLQLLEALARTPDLPGLLLIGAYRDQELHPDHPLTSSLQYLRKTPLLLHEYSLPPLARTDICRMVADTLHCEPRECKRLADICLEKTQGNPFFLTQFLQTLHQEELIRFENRRWVWDESSIREHEIADDVVALMVAKIRRLPLYTQQILKPAACIGNSFTLRILTELGEQLDENGVHFDPAETAQALWPALNAGLLMIMDDGHHRFRSDTLHHTRYRFAHDRIQQAAYSLISPKERSPLHLSIGRLLLRRCSTIEECRNTAVEGHLFEIVAHLNLASHQLNTQQDRLELAALNLNAGRRAREAAAFDSALEYLQAGLKLLPASCWQETYQLALELHIAAADAANAKRDFTTMESLIQTVQKNANNLLDRLPCDEIRIQSQVSQNRFAQALDTALAALSQLGAPLPSNPAKIQGWHQRYRTRRLIGGLQSERLLQAPLMKNAESRAALRLLSSMFGIVKFSSSSLRPLVMAKQVALISKYGLTEAAPLALASYGAVLCGTEHLANDGYRIGCLGVTMHERRGFENYRHKTLTIFNCYVRHFREPLSECLSGLLEAHRLSLECGDMEYAAYSLAAYNQYALPLSRNLAELQPQLERRLARLRSTGQMQSVQYSVMNLQAVANLRGRSHDPLRLDGDYYDEDTMLAEHQRENHRTAICLHHFYKALLAFVFEDHTTALHHCNSGIDYLPYIAGTFHDSWFRTLHALAELKQLSQLSPRQRLRSLASIGVHYSHLRRLAKGCPDNHAHRLALIQAELLRSHGRFARASNHFERAINLADKHGFGLEAAIATESAARCHEEWGRVRVARAYMTDAWHRYKAWGASAKASRLAAAAGLDPASEWQAAIRNSNRPDNDESAPKLSHHAFDMAAILKATQAISEEIVLDRLLDRLMHLVLANAGAQRGILLLSQQDRLSVEVEAGLDGNIRLHPSLPLEQAGKILPISIINYAIRTREPVVIDEMKYQPIFARDSYVQQHQPRTLLCLPILNHGRLTAMLYLEHGETAHVFDHQRLRALQTLTAQAAISIENAKLYQNLQESEREYRSLFENAVEGIFRISANGHFLSANPALVNLLGYHSAQHFMDSLSSGLRDCFTSEDMHQRFLHQLQHHERVINFECRWIRHDRKAIAVSISALQVQDEAGDLRYFEGSITDISERKAKEQAELAREKAEAANEAKSQFLAIMSHEIRTPMNGVLGMAQLLLRSPLNQQQREHLQALYQSGKNLLSILNDVLDLAKIEAGQMHLEQRDFSPESVLNDIHAILSPIAEESGIRLTITTDSTLPELVNGDRRALNQILFNLVMNALKFTEQGFVALESWLVDDDEQGFRLHFEVEDSGIGIPEEEQAQVFKTFYQVGSNQIHDGKHLHGGGTGLGLSICQQLVEIQGGNIGFTSQRGQGTRFWFEIPFQRAHGTSAVLQSSTPIQRPLHILLVEDTPINQQVICGLLESEGHTIGVAEDGFRALELHKRHAFDLILMDIHLPGMDGIETTRRIRALCDPTKSTIRVVALTASVTATDVQTYLEAGIDAVAGKPVELESLRPLLQGPQRSTDDGGPERQTTVTLELLDTTLLQQHREVLGKKRFEQLVETLPAHLETLTEKLQYCDTADDQSELLHRLAGGCANFGLKAAADRCRELEHTPSLSSDTLKSLRRLIHHSLSALSRSIGVEQ